jgi:hypothetical protein
MLDFDDTLIGTLENIHKPLYFKMDGVFNGVL